MNWAQENKFLSGFIAVVAIACLALGYLLYTAYSSYTDVSTQYAEAANQLNQLQSQDPYPNQVNLTKYQAERDDLRDATQTLAANLSQMVLPIRDMNPSAFQDKLRETIITVKDKADKTGVKLPDNFTFDMLTYQTQPPVPAAAGPLGRQLDALDIALNILMDEHVDAVTGFNRTRLPQEPGAAPTVHTAPGHLAPAAPKLELVEKYPFEIRFTASQASFQKVINDFASSSKQFFIARTLVIENSNPKPVAKTDDNSAGGGMPPGPAPGAAATTDTAANYLKFIVGTEKLNVTMHLDMIAFNIPEAAAHPTTHPAAAPAHTPAAPVTHPAAQPAASVALPVQRKTPAAQASSSPAARPPLPGASAPAAVAGASPVAPPSPAASVAPAPHSSP